MLELSMRKFLLILFISFGICTILFIQCTSGIEKHDQECKKCHQITHDEALNLIRDAIPGANILEIRAAQVKGLWEVAIEKGGQKGIVYVDFSKKMLLSGSIYNVKERINLTQERLIEINKVDVSQIPLDDALIMGAKNARYRVIVFTDPD